MNSYAFTDHNGTRFERMTKAEAFKRYAKGETITIVACKMRPGYPWSPEMDISIHDDAVKYANGRSDLQYRLDNFRMYNCQCETGYYVSFYMARRQRLSESAKG